MSHLFVSYSRKDKDCVMKLIHAMEEQDYTTWIDTEKIELTTEFEKEIEKAIRQARVFVLVWSANAADSYWVKTEMRIARKQMQEGNLVWLTIQIDDTELEASFSHLQAANLRGNCDSVTIHNFVTNTLNTDWKKFRTGQRLDQQSWQTIGNTGLVSVLVDYNQHCRASVFGLPNAVFSEPPSYLNIGLQFTRGTDLNIVEDMLSAIPERPAFGMWITGPKDDTGRSYSLPSDPIVWESCSQFIESSIKQIANERKTTLRIFAPIPGILLAGAMRGFSRFWHVQFYQLDRSSGYQLMIDQPRRNTH